MKNRLTDGVIRLLTEQYNVKPLGTLVSDLATAYFRVTPMVGSVLIPASPASMWFITDDAVNSKLRLGPVNMPERYQVVYYHDLVADISIADKLLAYRLANVMHMEEVDRAMTSYFKRVSPPHNDS